VVAAAVPVHPGKLDLVAAAPPRGLRVRRVAAGLGAGVATILRLGAAQVVTAPQVAGTEILGAGLVATVAAAAHI